MSNKRLALITILVLVLILRCAVGMTFSSIVVTSMWVGGSIAVIAAAAIIGLIAWLLYEDSLVPLAKRFSSKIKSKL